MILTTLILPLAVSAGIITERQFGTTKLAGVDKLQPKYRKTAQRTLTKFGPYTLNGANSSTGSFLGGMDSTLSGQMFMLNMRNGFCNDHGPCTIIAGRAGVMFTDGSKADPSTGIYIHHIISSDTSKKQTPWLSSCNSPSRAVRSVNAMGGGTGFIGTGEDTGDLPTMFTSMDGTRNSGYHLNRGDSFSANVQLVNYNKAPKQVYITWDTEWVEGIVGQDVKGVLISISQCGGNIKLSPSGPTNTTSGKFYIMEDGAVIRGRGHLHDGGNKMDLLINNKFVCASTAEYGTKAEGAGMGGHSHGDDKGDASIKTISAMSLCNDHIKVKKGDTLSMIVEYDLSKHPLRKSAAGSSAGVMGMWALSFMADK